MAMEDAAGFSDRLLCTALDVGEHLLICGGDIHRVEDTIIRICRAFGAVHTEAFTITSVIVASVRMPDGTYAHQMRRVYGSSNNMAELETLNSISRRLCAHEMTLDEAQAAVKAAEAEVETAVCFGTAGGKVVLPDQQIAGGKVAKAVI